MVITLMYFKFVLIEELGSGCALLSKPDWLAKLEIENSSQLGTHRDGRTKQWAASQLAAFLIYIIAGNVV